jgi:hypothetical protein
VLNIRKIIQEVLGEMEINESAAEASEALSSGIGLINYVRGGLESLVLHDFNTDENVGIIFIKKEDIGYEVYSVNYPLAKD